VDKHDERVNAMNQIHFPQAYRHDHAKVRDVNDLVEEQMSFADRAADVVAGLVGSWRFIIIIQSLILCVWVLINSIALLSHWDPYPFILMNLLLSTEAAFATPIIMMSQNRQAAIDRIEAHNDYEINVKAEEELRVVLSSLEAQNAALAEIHAMLRELRAPEDDSSTNNPN
jgi:uncharacterized membrane protein